MTGGILQRDKTELSSIGICIPEQPAWTWSYPAPSASAQREERRDMVVPRCRVHKLSSRSHHQLHQLDQMGALSYRSPTAAGRDDATDCRTERGTERWTLRSWCTIAKRQSLWRATSLTHPSACGCRGCVQRKLAWLDQSHALRLVAQVADRVID